MSCICNLCQRCMIEPIHLNCKHEFCFTCIRNYCNQSGNECFVCRSKIDRNIFRNYKSDNIQFESKFYWLYEGKNESWWCYDKRSNDRIEKLYNNFKAPKLRENDMVKNCPNSVQSIKKKISPYDPKHSTVNFQLIREMEMYNSGIENKRSCEKNMNFNNVNFSSTNNNKYNRRIKIPLSNTLKIGDAQYIINFNKLIQVNKTDCRKQRKIKRVEIMKTNPHHILKSEHNVRGVAGIYYK